ncbi:uncharacterized protein A4U43_C05F8310 [Asparagus officinalis]|uniref:Uncharacterized protein n=1 Tax=Asparagus officinalis TaxID=4686 RepID=A0A5P1EVM5_ASPOF|nr:uncharacterized protein A4U43_C05F8310 [Asparagus officinalis]
MEIPIIESGISRLQSPNSILHLKVLLTCAALIIAAIATFSSLIRRSKRIILIFRRGKSVFSHPFSCPYSSDDGDSCCLSDEESDAEDQEEEEDELSSCSEKDFGDFKEIQDQNGKSDQHFFWPQLSRDESVVKLWDNLGLRFDPRNDSIGLLDLNRDEDVRSFLSKPDDIWAVHVAHPGTLLSAGRGGVKVWDAREAAAGPTEPAHSTWRMVGHRRLVRGLGGGINEVYLGDDEGRLAAVDIRNVRSWGDGDGAVTEATGASKNKPKTTRFSANGIDLTTDATGLLRESGDEGVLGDGGSTRHFVEQLVSKIEGADRGGGVEHGGGDMGVGVEAALYGGGNVRTTMRTDLSMPWTDAEGRLDAGGQRIGGSGEAVA